MREGGEGRKEGGEGGEEEEERGGEGRKRRREGEGREREEEKRKGRVYQAEDTNYSMTVKWSLQSDTSQCGPKLC